MAEMTLEQQRALARMRMRARAKTASQNPAYSGSILPLSRDHQGNVSFDSNAGLIGAVKRAFTLPGEVMRGDVPVRDDAGNITDEVIGRAGEMAAVVSPANPMVRSGDKVIPGAANNIRRKEMPAPTADQLATAAGRGYDAFRSADVIYPGSSVSKMAQEIAAELNKSGFDDTVSPGTFRILDKLTRPGEGAFQTPANAHALKKNLGRVRGGTHPEDETAAAIAKRKLVEALSSGNTARPMDRAAAREAGETLLEADRNFAASKRSELVAGIGGKAKRRAAVANSGQNVGNTIRQRIATAIDKPRQISGFTDEEIAALDKVAMGTPAENRLRAAGNFLGGGGGFAGVTTTGIGGAAGTAAGLSLGSPVAGGAIGAAVPLAAGVAAKRASNKMTEKSLQAVDEMIRKRSPLYEAMQKNAPIVAGRDKSREAIMRALLLTEGARSGGGGY